jgi:epoxyqueuosine reductase
LAHRKKWTQDSWPGGAEFWQRFRVPLSGSAFNGLGERVKRRARQIFWQRDPRGHTFGELQAAVVGRFDSIGVLHEVYAHADRGPRRDANSAAERVAATAEVWTQRLKAFARNDPGARPTGYAGAGSEAELVGIVSLDKAWLYEGFDSSLPRLVMLGVVMDHSRLDQLPGDETQFEGQLEVSDQYNRGARVANNLALWIQRQGYEARVHAGPWVGSLNMIPAALAAGFGELGKHGSIINRTYGSSFRLAAVETDMPLLSDQPDRFGADEFCTRCAVCTNYCPPQAINVQKQWVRGELKWYVDFDKCIPYFNETYSCGICLAVCPWSTPGRAPKLADVWTLRVPTAAQSGLPTHD